MITFQELCRLTKVMYPFIRLCFSFCFYTMALVTEQSAKAIVLNSNDAFQRVLV